MESPFFSIIIPVFNAAPYLVQCLDSWEKQSFQSFELILVDDGSTDNSSEICKGYEGRLPGFKFFKKENGGASSARNAGLSFARGEFVGFCDADDCVCTDLLSELYRIIVQSQCDVAVFHIGRPRRGVRPVFHISNSIEKRSREWLCIHMLTDDTIMGSACNKYIRRTMIRQPFNTSLTHCEDCEWVFRILGDNKNARIVESSSVLYAYTYNDTSVTKRKDNDLDCNGVSKYIPSLIEMSKVEGFKKPVYRELSATLYCFALDNVYAYELPNSTVARLKPLIRSGRFPMFFSANRTAKEKMRFLKKEIISAIKTYDKRKAERE